MDNITLYTCITGGKDTPVEQDWTITRFIDSYDKFKDPRRNSRIQKMMPHKYFNTEYSIYIDGNMKLLISPEEVIKRYMKGYDIAFFRHGVRDCIYDEAIAVAKLGLDDVEAIIEQAKHYEDIGYGKHKGLLQGGFIVRKNNKKVQDFNEAWWADFCRYSRRDQLSLMPALDKVGLVVNMIDEYWVQDYQGKAWIGGVLEMGMHKNLEGNFNEKK